MDLFTFKQGIHPDYHKELTRNKPLKKAKRPDKVFIPLQQHIGAPLQPLVEKGDHVDFGQKIADTDSFVAAPVHASVSGEVTEIKDIMTPAGTTSTAIIIESDAEDELNSNLVPHNNLEEVPADEIREIVREAGITGMGGAMFPTHVKLSVPEDKEVDYFILNGAECEPYLTVDHRMMIENPGEIVAGMKLMMRAVEVEKGFIGIEDNKQEAIESMREAVAEEDEIDVEVFATKYPQGGEKMMIKAALDREVPEGGLPLDVGVVVNNVTTAIAVYDAVFRGIPLVERTITVTGSAVADPQNFIYKIGTPVADLIEQAGGFSEEPGKVVLGGPMTGQAQTDTNVPGVKGTSGILVLSREEVDEYDPDPCIRCARCVDSCPMYLMPVQLANLTRTENYEELSDYNITNCIECGSCSYVCPSNRPLLHYIKLGKAKVMALQNDED